MIPRLVHRWSVLVLAVCCVDAATAKPDVRLQLLDTRMLPIAPAPRVDGRTTTTQLEPFTRAPIRVCDDRRVTRPGCVRLSDEVWMAQAIEWRGVHAKDAAAASLAAVVQWSDRGCTVWLAGEQGAALARCDNLQLLAGAWQRVGPPAWSPSALRDTAAASVNRVTPLLQKCGRVAASQDVTPDRDAEEGHRWAREAINVAYAGNRSEFRAFQRLDVHYPKTDQTVRLLILQVDGEPPQGPWLHLRQAGLVPAGAASPCVR